MNWGYGKAACGHYGPIVIGTYAQCPVCDVDAIPVEIDEDVDITKKLCPECGSDDLEFFRGLWVTNRDKYYCHHCSKIFDP